MPSGEQAGAVYYHVGRQAEAEACARQCAELAEASLGPRHPRLATYLSNYAVVLKHGEQKSQAKAIQKRAEEITAGFTSARGGYTVNIAALR